MNAATQAAEDTVSPRAPRASRRVVARSPFVQRYWAFISYSHRDSADAEWLHGALEKYRFPRALVGRGTASGVVPPSLSPVFRDRQELAAGDLDNALIEALATSRVLIVLCSPAAAASRWTNEEVRLFKQHRPDGVVLAAIVSGEPWAADMPGHEAEECFPPALKQRFDARGRPTAERAEPIAADFRPEGDGRELGLLKIVAGIAGLRLDDLVQRDAQRRQRRMMTITGASVAASLLASALAYTAIQARDEARDQRRQAEGLVGFMLGDLKDKLAPLGRLDALDAVGTRALAYFESQDKSSLSEAALAQRSRALTMMGELSNTRGDLDGALRQYREALASTAEALRRAPDDPQRMFDHAQNVYWVGYIDWQRGHLDRAESAFREYQVLAKRMIATDPGNEKWQLEKGYADQNLGVVLLEIGKPEAAEPVFQDLLSRAETMLGAKPNDRSARETLVETLAYLSDARSRQGRFEDAIADRERALAMLAGWQAQSPADVFWLKRSAVVHRALERLFEARGQLKDALEHGSAANSMLDRLIAAEPKNSDWLEKAAGAAIEHGGTLLFAGRREEAGRAIRAGCDRTSRLIALNPSVVAWSETLRGKCATARAQLALAEGSPTDALPAALIAIVAAQKELFRRAPDSVADLGYALSLRGNVLASLGRKQEALQDWQEAAQSFAIAPARPNRLAERAMLAVRLGDLTTAGNLQRQLASYGYRRPDYVAAMAQNESR